MHVHDNSCTTLSFSCSFLFSLLLFLIINVQQASSSCTRLLFFLPKPPTKITWVNGIGYNHVMMTNGQISISSLFGGQPVLFCHNPTSMTTDDDYFGYIGDLTQAGTQKLGRITSEVDALVRHLKQAVESVGPYGRVIHIAHSQGALITFLASKRLTKSEMTQMEVICFGGAEVIQSTEDFPFARCINYYSINDPLLFVVPKADKALRSGFLYSMANDNEEPEFVFLTPRSGDPVMDHGLLGPTYREALTWEGQRYQKVYLPLWYPIIQKCIMHGSSFHVTLVQSFTYILQWFLARIILPIIAFVMHTNRLIYERILVPWIQVMYYLWSKKSFRHTLQDADTCKVLVHTER